MCGRYVSPDTAAIERAFHVGRTSSNPFKTRYNVAPTTQIPVLRLVPGLDGYELTEARWSFVPYWWKQPKPPQHGINARSEDVAAKPMWKDAFRGSRCLVPALGYYEWQTAQRADPKTGEIKPYKQPYYIQRPDKRLFCFAGLMSKWKPEGKEPILTVALMTRAAAPSVKKIHDRMPVVLPEKLLENWASPEIRDSEAIATIIQRSETDFVSYPVSTRLNGSKDDDEELARPLALT
jgi:putative SOS response-associated peptidase YedK